MLDFIPDELFLCSLCYKEYPNNVETCPLEHCKFCGDTSLEIVPARIFKDPIFILINTLFALLLVYAFFNQDIENIGSLLLFGVFLYAIGLGMFLSATDRRPLYYCKNCRTTVKNPLTDTTIGEFDHKPDKKEIIQSVNVPKTHHVKEAIMIIGSVGSVLSIFLIFWVQGI